MRYTALKPYGLNSKTYTLPHTPRTPGPIPYTRLSPRAPREIYSRDQARAVHRDLVISATPLGAAAAAVTVGLELPGPAGRSSIGRTGEG